MAEPSFFEDCKMKFVLTCGGTAGHINPAVAVAQRLQEQLPDCEILFLGAEGKMEMDLVPREGFRILPLKVTNLSRGHHLEDISHNLHSLKKVIDAGHEARRILKEFRPDAVLGTGGYVCYPVLHEAAKLGIPTLIHESNAVPGLTTKMLSGHVSCVLLGYEESAGHYPAVQDLRVTGTPVRDRFCSYTRELAREELGIPAGMPLVVSMWGSLGSGHMNDILVKMIPLMKGQQDFCMIHATGSYYHDAVTEKLKAAGIVPAACRFRTRAECGGSCPVPGRGFDPVGTQSHRETRSDCPVSECHQSPSGEECATGRTCRRGESAAGRGF